MYAYTVKYVWCISIHTYIHAYCYFDYTGIDVDTPQGHMKAHAVLLICCVDLPAQAKLLNMKQYNGKYGCHACEDEGIPRPGAHMQRNWPFNLSCNLRTHDSVKCNARQAVGVRQPVSHALYHAIN